MVMDMVKETLELDAYAARNAKIILWPTPFYDILVVNFALFNIASGWSILLIFSEIIV